jgi:TolB-like protein
MPLGALLLVLTAAAPAQGPVAVLPFRNLGADATLTWLERGMTETLTADLKRAKTVQVVERSEVEKALATVIKNASETDQALALGKLTSARTVVLGSFQRSGDKVRIAARFVTVETGIITEAAHATGPLDAVFTVQDALVAKLLGARLAVARRGRPARAIRAFEAYGKSLTAKDDTERKALLVASVKEDPGFSYAVDDLAALEKRMAGYAQTSSFKLVGLEATALSKVEDTKEPEADRIALAGTLLDTLVEARRFHSLAAAAPRMAAAKGIDVRETAAYGAFAAQMGLHRYDAALGAGEKFLKDYPTSRRFKDVETQMRSVVTARKKRASRRAEYEADLADKLKGCRGRDCAYAPCIASRWTSQVGQLMLDNCTAFLSKHGADKDADAQEQISAARYFSALSLVELGEWKKAEGLIEALEKGPDRGWDDEIAALRAQWPAD